MAQKQRENDPRRPTYCAPPTTKGALTRHSSMSGAVSRAAGALGQPAAQARAVERGRHGSKGWFGADRSSSGGGGPAASPCRSRAGAGARRPRPRRRRRWRSTLGRGRRRGPRGRRGP
eukprot:1111557-Alexandrium_andersonii.AAC.1